MCQRYPVVIGAAFGSLLAVCFAAAIWNPITAVLLEGHAAETRRLIQAFEKPLSVATAKGDDLARIDEMHRLEKLPGVSNAHIDETGRLKITVSRSSWNRLRYRCLERLGNLVVSAGLIGALAGGSIRHRLRAFRIRLRRILSRSHQRYKYALERLKDKKEAELIPWTRQALDLSPAGLILLDQRQTVVAFSPKAGAFFQLETDAIGAHWLDLQKSAVWAAALRKTLEHPGEQIPLSTSDRAGPISLLTLSTAGCLAASTWIILPTA